ncbi:MAG: transposase [Oscillospiraceae bacterium]|nr:transposase [Oscillospiraceae bacterium]
MRRYTEEEKRRAVEQYYEEELTTQETVERLGYPTRQHLERWLRMDDRYGESFYHGFYSTNIKIEAVRRYLSGQYKAREIAEQLDIRCSGCINTWTKS